MTAASEDIQQEADGTEWNSARLNHFGEGDGASPSNFANNENENVNRNLSTPGPGEFCGPTRRKAPEAI